MTKKTAVTPGGVEYRPSIKGLQSRSLKPAMWSKILAILVMVIVLIYFIFPIYWVIIASRNPGKCYGGLRTGEVQIPL